MAPPAGWKNWQSPQGASRLPIDEEIDALRNRKRRPFLRSANELARFGVLCPYYHARHWIELARAQCEHFASNYSSAAASHTADVRATLQKTTALQKSLVAFNSDDTLTWLLGRWPGPFFLPPDHTSGNDIAAEINRSLDAVRTAEVAANRLVELLQLEIDAVQRHSRTTQKSIFAAMLGFCWRTLTGDDPSPGVTGPFVSFVSKAFESADYTEDDRSAWERAVRTAVAAVQAKSSFDHYEQSPGTSGIIPLDQIVSDLTAKP